jgi:protein required for attachment to host cells
MTQKRKQPEEETTWIVIISQAKMKIFEQSQKDHELQHLKTLENPMVNSLNRDISNHSPGVVVEGGRGARHHVMSGSDDPHDIETAAYLSEMAEYLDHQRRQQHVEHLLIAAEPKVLGHLKASMSHKTLAIVRAWIAKDLEKEPTQRLAQEVNEANRLNPSP